LSLLVGILSSIDLALDIWHNLTIGSLCRLFLRNGVGVLALGIGHNLTIRSFGRLFFRNVVGVLALALDNPTDNLREMLSGRDATQRRHINEHSRGLHKLV